MYNSKLITYYCRLGGPAPGRPGSGPGPLGPGARVTGPRALGLADASDTSFCTCTPPPAVPGFTFGDFPPSGLFSKTKTNNHEIMR